MFLRFTHVDTRTSNSLFFNCLLYYFIVWVYHSLIILYYIDGQLNCFQFFVVINSAVMVIMFSCAHVGECLWCINLEVKLLSCGLCTSWIIIAKLLSEAVLIYTPTSIIQEFLFPHILASVVDIFRNSSLQEKNNSFYWFSFMIIYIQRKHWLFWSLSAHKNVCWYYLCHYSSFKPCVVQISIRMLFKMYKIFSRLQSIFP